MAPWFAKNGCDVRVISAVPYYPEWESHPEYSPTRYHKEVSENLTVWRCPLYIPSRVTLVRRILLLLSFTFSSLPILFRQLFWKPDIIIVVEPVFFTTPAALIFSFLTRAKAWLHIQDFEIDAMLNLGLARIPSWLTNTILATEKFLMRRFDYVSSISYKMLERANAKTEKPEVPAIFFPNWVDTQHMYLEKRTGYYRKLWSIDQDTTVVLYSGNLGNKQGLDIIIEAARKLQSENMVFLIIGNGTYKDELLAMSQQSGLNNIQFHPLQPFEKLPELLAEADIHLVIQKRGASDIVMPSKLTSILAAGGRAIVTADLDTELGILAGEHPGVFDLIEPEDSGVLTNAILSASSKCTEEGRINLTAREYAEKYLASDMILSNIHNQITKLLR
jgi:colanic acid biosynthesis glycosyl transferase WcaI